MRLEDPPANDSFIELLFAQGAVRTAAARVGDRNLIDELQRLSDLTSKVARLDASDAGLGAQAGEVAADLIFGASEMIANTSTWADAKKAIYGQT